MAKHDTPSNESVDLFWRCEDGLAAWAKRMRIPYKSLCEYRKGRIPSAAIVAKIAGVTGETQTAVVQRIRAAANEKFDRLARQVAAQEAA